MPPVAPPHPARTRQTYAIQVLQWLGAPVTENNIRALLAQMLAEEPAGEGAGNNPFNTTRDIGKYPGWSASPNIPVYPSWHIGVQETVATYRSPLYAQVVRDLKASADPRKTVSDIGSSPWGTSGSLMQQLLGSGGDLAKSSTVPGAGLADITRSTGFQTDPISSTISGAKDAVGGAFDWVKNAISSVLTFAVRGGKILLGVLFLAAAIFIGVKT